MHDALFTAELFESEIALRKAELKTTLTCLEAPDVSAQIDFTIANLARQIEDYTEQIKGLKLALDAHRETLKQAEQKRTELRVQLAAALALKDPSHVATVVTQAAADEKALAKLSREYGKDHASVDAAVFRA